MQSGVTTSHPDPSLSVCPRLRTGTHSSDRKVRPNSVQLLHYPSIHSSIFSTHSSFHWSSFTVSSILRDAAAHFALAPSYLPPHPPAHVIPLSICTVSSLFNHLSPHFLSSCLSQRQPLLLNPFSIYFCPNKCTTPVDPQS